MKYRSLTYIYAMRSILVSHWPIILIGMTFIHQVVFMILGKITHTMKYRLLWPSVTSWQKVQTIWMTDVCPNVKSEGVSIKTKKKVYYLFKVSQSLTLPHPGAWILEPKCTLQGTNDTSMNGFWWVVAEIYPFEKLWRKVSLTRRKEVLTNERTNIRLYTPRHTLPGVSMKTILQLLIFLWRS